MKQIIITIVVFLFTSTVCYAIDKVRGELRTEINGFQWYCYNNVEAYSVDGRKLFEEVTINDKPHKINKIYNISFLTADKYDKGIFVVNCKSKVHEKIFFDCNGKFIHGIGCNDEFHRIKEVFSNKFTRYYTRQFRRPNEYWLIDDDGKILIYSYEEYTIVGNMFLVKESEENLFGGKLYRIVRYDGKVIQDYLHSIRHIKDANQILVSYIYKYSTYWGILDAETGKTIISGAKKIEYDGGFIKIEKNGGKGLMSYNCKWIIKPDQGYTGFETLKANGYYCKVRKGGRYGLTDAEGKVIVPTEMEALESAGTGYLRYKLNGFWGLMNYQGKILIDTDRGYTSIGDYKSFNKRFAYTMAGYIGECDAMGRPVSKIKVDTPKQNTSVASSSSSSSSGSSSSTSSSSSNSSSGNKTTTVVVEHHRDPIPVQEWQQCTNCWGEGKVMCLGACGGTGTYYVGDRLHICISCNGTGKKICPYCSGQGGKYVTVYR